MNPNLVQGSCTYKDLLLRKLSYAVSSSVLTQLFLLQTYVLLTTINIFHPLEWLMGALWTILSFSTWLFMLPFLLIVFAQALICAKDYVVKPSYCSTRFQKFVQTFSVHNLLLVFLHIVVGAVLTWLYLSFSGSKLYNKCKGDAYCLDEDCLFLILSGLWTGLYYFIKVYIAEKNLQFPVVHQRKFLQLKSQVGPLITESISLSFWPALSFSCFYYIYGNTISGKFITVFGLLDHRERGTKLIYLYLWFFSALYYFNMNLMRFYFNLFLTEPVQFPLTKDNVGDLTLQESITNYEWPIVQNLACLDLYFLSQWFPIRRQFFFAISNPGGHPHNWNLLVENILKLFTEFNQLLGQALDVPEAVGKPIIQAPLIQGPDKFRNLRNMALVDQDDFGSYINVMDRPARPKFMFFVNIITSVQTKVMRTWNFLKIILGINFLFGELPQANIRKFLANGNLIIWSAQGVAEIVTVSLKEDKFGVVLKDLPVIITSLVSLKQALDKLNKIPSLTRRVAGQDDFNYKMKRAVNSSVKRSLLHICRSFENYLNDISLSRDVLDYLQTHICRG